MALLHEVKFTGVATISQIVLERSFVSDFIAVIVVKGLDRCLQHPVWCGIWCLIAVAVIAFLYAFVGSSLVEVDCGTDCFSTKDTCRLRVTHHRLCSLADGVDDLFVNSMLIVSLGSAWLICYAMSTMHHPEGHVAILSVCIIAP